MLNFSIITPSYNQSEWLKLCIASVVDQEGVELEHIVQDAYSTDGTQEWLASDSRVKAFIETDNGMYDAINRGMRRARGDILAYLNCDEQYLPGALINVRNFFERHPNVDVVFANAIVIDNKGEFVCHRKALVPTRNHTLVSGNLSILTCATFFRRRLLEEWNLFFDTRWLVIGDGEWILRVIKSRAKMDVINHFTSVFCDTKKNLSLSKNAQHERRRFLNRAPYLAKKNKSIITACYRLRKLIYGCYWQKPFSYSIFTSSKPCQRKKFRVEHPKFFWKSRMKSRNYFTSF